MSKPKTYDGMTPSEPKVHPTQQQAIAGMFSATGARARLTAKNGWKVTFTHCSSTELERLAAFAKDLRR